MTDHARAIEAGARADLLPCPFCGGVDVVCCDQGDNDFAVTCKSCGATSPFDDVEANAIAAWNKRAAIASGALVPASAGQPTPTEYKVKPLKWRGPISSYPTTVWEAKTTFGHYVIEEVSASDCPAYEVRLLMSLVAVKDTVDEAEAAAQADYAQRIRSALDTAPASGDCTHANKFTRTKAGNDLTPESYCPDCDTVLPMLNAASRTGDGK